MQLIKSLFYTFYRKEFFSLKDNYNKKKKGCVNLFIDIIVNNVFSDFDTEYLQ